MELVVRQLFIDLIAVWLLCGVIYLVTKSKRWLEMGIDFSVFFLCFRLFGLAIGIVASIVTMVIGASIKKNNQPSIQPETTENNRTEEEQEVKQEQPTKEQDLKQEQSINENIPDEITEVSVKGKPLTAPDESTPAKSNSKPYIAVIMVLLVAVAGLGYYVYDLTEENRRLEGSIAFYEDESEEYQDKYLSKKDEVNLYERYICLIRNGYYHKASCDNAYNGDGSFSYIYLKDAKAYGYKKCPECH